MDMKKSLLSITLSLLFTGFLLAGQGNDEVERVIESNDFFISIIFV
jgi:hypothetical protein